MVACFALITPHRPTFQLPFAARRRWFPISCDCLSLTSSTLLPTQTHLSLRAPKTVGHATTAYRRAADAGLLGSADTHGADSPAPGTPLRPNGSALLHSFCVSCAGLSWTSLLPLSSVAYLGWPASAVRRGAPPPGWLTRRAADPGINALRAMAASRREERTHITYLALYGSPRRLHWRNLDVRDAGRRRSCRLPRAVLPSRTCASALRFGNYPPLSCTCNADGAAAWQDRRYALYRQVPHTYALLPADCFAQPSYGPYAD